MSTNTTTPDNNGQEFNLKHRITGAAVLLFFGALVIPWLLGPPSAASKQGVSEVAGDEATLASAKEIERVLLGPDAQTAEVPEETVYISKITPLDGASKPEAEDTQSEQQTVAPKTVKTEAKSEKTPAVTESVVKKETAVAKQEPKKPDTKSTTKAQNEAKQGQDEQKAREQALLAALEAESKSDLTVGWIVQVGLFVEKSGAEAQVKSLKDKGFSAKTTVVDTNRGPNTGTRVWIGPFEKRTEAESHNQQLRAKMGKAGFIRVYP